jgi:hypothetical protein
VAVSALPEPAAAGFPHSLTSFLFFITHPIRLQLMMAPACASVMMMHQDLFGNGSGLPIYSVVLFFSVV